MRNSTSLRGHLMDKDTKPLHEAKPNSNQAIKGVEQMVLFVTQGFIAEGHDVETAKELTCQAIEDVYQRYTEIAQLDRPMKRPSASTLNLAQKIVDQLNQMAKGKPEIMAVRNLAVELLTALKRG
jgi:hypothetical protein